MTINKDTKYCIEVSIAGPLAIFPSLGMVLRVSMWPTVQD